MEYPLNRDRPAGTERSSIVIQSKETARIFARLRSTRLPHDIQQVNYRKLRITADTSLRLARYFGPSPQFPGELHHPLAVGHSAHCGVDFQTLVRIPPSLTGKQAGREDVAGTSRG